MSDKMKAEINDWRMPCIKFDGATVNEQLDKTKEELLEVEDSYEKYRLNPCGNNRVELLMEIADVEACLTTLLHKLGVDKVEMDAARCLVWHKNELRGYHDPE